MKKLALSCLSIAATASAVAFTATTGSAQITVLDNLGNTIAGSSNSTTVAEAFVTGASSFVLSDVIFPQILQGPSPGTYYNNYVTGETLSLYSSDPANGLPLNSLVSLKVTPGPDSDTTATALTPGFGQSTAVVPSDATSRLAATLLANTKYWFVLNSPTAASWNYTHSTNYLTNGSGFTLPATGACSEAGGTTYPLSAGPQQLTIQIVPEPSTWALLGVGAVGAGAVVLRRRQALRD